MVKNKLVYYGEILSVDYVPNDNWALDFGHPRKATTNLSLDIPKRKLGAHNFGRPIKKTGFTIVEVPKTSSGLLIVARGSINNTL